MDRLKYLSADDDVRAIADLRQKDLNDRISERNAALALVEEVRAKSEKEKAELKSKAEKREQELKSKADAEKRESAKTALAMGLTIEQVQKITGLSIEEINEIKKKLQ